MKNSYSVKGDIVKINVIHKGTSYTVLIDTADLEKVKSLNSVNVGVSGGRYRAKCWNKDKSQWLHRFILDAQEGQIVDHINRDPLDNRRSNLRIVDRKTNNRNSKIHATNSTGYRWVCFDRGKYRGRFTYNDKKYCAGFHETPEKALDAVLDLRTSLGISNTGIPLTKDYQELSLEEAADG